MDNDSTSLEIIRVLTLALFAAVIYAVMYLVFQNKRLFRNILEFDRRDSGNRRT